MSAYQAVALDTMAAMAGYTHPRFERTAAQAALRPERRPSAGLKTALYAAFLAVLCGMLVIRSAGIDEVKKLEAAAADAMQAVQR